MMFLGVFVGMVGVIGIVYGFDIFCCMMIIWDEVEKVLGELVIVIIIKESGKC